MQKSYPGWGYWVSMGATTCWESWAGIQNPSHPGVNDRPLNPPTHNHIFLCGGVGEWMFRSLAGIAPAAPGYAVVHIAPKISRHLDPASVNASVRTVRGVVSSSWTRYHSTCRANLKDQAGLIQMIVSVPVGMLANIQIPLLGLNPSRLRLLSVMGSGVQAAKPIQTVLWDAGPTLESLELKSIPWLQVPPTVQSDCILLQTTAVDQLVLLLEGPCS